MIRGSAIDYDRPCILLQLMHGIVIETEVESITGEFLYSDFATGYEGKNSTLNCWAKIPLIGSLAGITRVVLAVIHILGHLLAYIIPGREGNLFHAAKGACEILRGCIETIPIIGSIFAYLYTFPRCGARSWWMIKIYNPKKIDALVSSLKNCLKKFEAIFLDAGALRSR